MLENYLRQHLAKPASNKNAELDAIKNEKAALQQLENQLNALDKKALDIMQPDSVIDEVMTQRQKLELQIARSKKAIEKLEERAEEAAQSELEGGRVKRYDDAIANRDAVIKRLQNDYDRAQAVIVDVLQSVDASNREILQVNADLPAEAEKLNTAEGTVRGYIAHQSYYYQGLPGHPISLTACKLVSLEGHSEYSWPISKPALYEHKKIHEEVLICALKPLSFVKNENGVRRMVESAHPTWVRKPVAKLAVHKMAALLADGEKGKKLQDELSHARATRPNYSSRFASDAEIIDLGDPLSLLEDGIEADPILSLPQKPRLNRAIIEG